MGCCLLDAHLPSLRLQLYLGRGEPAACVEVEYNNPDGAEILLRKAW